MRSRFVIHPACAWVNYVRVHDDIGWTFSDEDASVLGINGNDHRRFLNQFFTDRFPGSYASGLPFQENPKTGDCRISGTGASLAGLEKALAAIAAESPDGGTQREHAIGRILVIHGIILSIGGIPLINLGDEIGTLNDYSFRDDPATVEGQIFIALSHLVAQRKAQPVFAGGEMRVLETASDHVFAFARARATADGALNECPLNECPLNECPLNECPLNECPLNECPLNECPLNECPLNERPLNERPLNERPLNERPLNERPLNERPLNERPLNERPLNERPLNERPLNERLINERLIVLANFSESPQPANIAPTRGVSFGRSPLDLVTGEERLLTPDIVLEPLQLMWLLVKSSGRQVVGSSSSRVVAWLLHGHHPSTAPAGIAHRPV